jgi:enediyne polyketide synthase
MFPGQASTVRFNAGSLDKFSKVNEIYNKYCVNFNDKLNTSHAQPCIVLSEISGLVLLEELGVKADIAIGHSLGELVALYWGGSIDQDSLIDLAKERGKIMNDESIEGYMTAVSGEISLIQKIAQESDVDISAYNKKQVVVSGSPHNIQIFIEKAELKNLNTIKLPVKKPFHSRLMKNSAGKLENYLTNFDIKPCDKKVVSTITGNLIENNIKENLVKQLVEPVMFSQAFDNFSNECDYLIEVGPGDVLTKLSGHDKVLTLDCCSESIDGLLKGVGAIYAFGGQDLNFDLLKNRFYKKYKLIKSFFSNQCETFQKLDLIETLPEKEEIKKETNQSTIDIFKEILSKKVELNISDIKENQNLLKDFL